MNDEERRADWAAWRFELAAYGKYVELTFDGVRLGDEADVERWAWELESALAHYRRPIDVLLDLRGVRVSLSAAESCGERFLEILRRHARSLAYFGADSLTEAALGPVFAEHGHARGWPERATALSHLMERRRARRAARNREVTPISVPSSGRAWEESGAVSL